MSNSCILINRQFWNDEVKEFNYRKCVIRMNIGSLHFDFGILSLSVIYVENLLTHLAIVISRSIRIDFIQETY